MTDDAAPLRCHTCKKILRALTVCAWCVRPTHRGCWDTRGCGVCAAEPNRAEGLAILERVLAQ